jgi:cation transport regulator
MQRQGQSALGIRAFSDVGLRLRHFAQQKGPKAKNMQVNSGASRTALQPWHSACSLQIATPHASRMPYLTNQDLPSRVQRNLPEHAQDIYREAFNHAWQTYAHDPRQEEISHRIAWAAVKKSYAKAGDEWVLRVF